MDGLFTKNFWNTITKNNISYPWITAEVVWDWKHVFEPNFNCWILWVALSYLDQVEEKDREILYRLAISIFEEVRLTHEKIILIWDEALWNVLYLKSILKWIFWEWNFSIVTTQMTNWKRNSLTWSAIRSSNFTSEENLINEVKKNPDAVVLSTIPYSDPRVWDILETLKWLEDTNAYKSLRLLDLNSSRLNHVEIAWKEIWHLWVINWPWEIFQFVDSTKKIIVKTIDGSAWGTGINVLLNEAQIAAFNEKADFSWSWYIINKYIHPKVLRNGNEEFSFHIRPFFSWTWEYLGSWLKISWKPINLNVTWAWWNAFKKIEEWFNSSSWNSRTFIFDKNWKLVIWFASKNTWYLWSNEALEYLSVFEFEWRKLTEQIINDLALNSFYIIRNIQSKTNTLLWLN
jgi:hypothetical protein